MRSDVETKELTPGEIVELVKSDGIILETDGVYVIISGKKYIVVLSNAAPDPMRRKFTLREIFPTDHSIYNVVTWSLLVGLNPIFEKKIIRPPLPDYLGATLLSRDEVYVRQNEDEWTTPGKIKWLDEEDVEKLSVREEYVPVDAVKDVLSRYDFVGSTPVSAIIDQIRDKVEEDFVED